MRLIDAIIISSIITVILGIVLLVWLVSAYVYGQDFDPCMVQNNEMFQRICDKIEIEKIYQQLLERAREWNEIYK